VVTALLEATGLVRRYGGRAAVDDVTLQVMPGEVLAIAGPNGAGKSTLFRLLLLLERPDSGEIRLRGEAVRTRSAAARQRLTGVFQRAVLFTGTVHDNIEYGLRTRRLSRAERVRRVADALDWFELGALAHTSVHALSGGEAQRVALARALVTEPDVLLMDEPTAGLDVSMRRRFRRDLEQVGRRHARSMVFITHDVEDALAVADRIAVMEAGRLVQVDTPAQVVLRPATPFVAELTGAELLLHGTVVEVRDGLPGIRLTSDILLWATPVSRAGLPLGSTAVVAYRPEDIVLGADAGHPSSAINRLPAQVAAVVPGGAVVRVLLRLGGNPDLVLTALLTTRSAAALSLSPGTDVTAWIKATALHAWSRGVERTAQGSAIP
jgi:putrescine transport system ATP-binding protein